MLIYVAGCPLYQNTYVSGDRSWQAAQSTADRGREQIFNDSEGGEIEDIDDKQSSWFSGETWFNLLSSCFFRGALAEVSGRVFLKMRSDLGPVAPRSLPPLIESLFACSLQPTADSECPYIKSFLHDMLHKFTDQRGKGQKGEKLCIAASKSAFYQLEMSRILQPHCNQRPTSQRRAAT